MCVGEDVEAERTCEQLRDREGADPVEGPPGRGLCATGLLLGALILASPSALRQHTATPATPGGRVVIIAVADLRWEDVSAGSTPTLWRMADQGSIGLLSVRAVGRHTGCAAGWLTLGAGNRADGSELDSGHECGPGLVAATDSGQLDKVRRSNRAASFAAHPGALGDALHAAGLRTAVVGNADGILGAADSRGQVDAQMDLAGESWGPASLVIVGVSELYKVDRSTRPSAVARVDRVVDVVTRFLRVGDVVLVVGFSDQAHGPPQLHVAVASGASWSPGVLRSASTGRTGFVQLIDVAPTVLEILGVRQPAVMVGQPWFRAAPRQGPLLGELRHFVDLSRAADVSKVTRRFFLDVFAAAQVVLYAGAALLLWRWGRGRFAAPALAALMEFVALGVALLPAASFAAQAVPWWRAGGVLFYPLVIAICATGALAARRVGCRFGSWAAVTAVAAASAGLLCADVLLGSPLQLSSLLGDSPILAGRFRGVGNIDFAVLSTTTLLAAGGVALALRRAGRPKVGIVAAAVIVLLALVLDGAPPFGADLGGAMALGPAALLLMLLLSRGRVSWPRAIASAAAGVVPAMIFAAYDYALPTSRQSHIGRFVGQVLHGGAWTVVHRRVIANIHQLTHPTYLVILLMAAIALGALLLPLGPGRRAPLATALAGHPELKFAFYAAAVCGLLGDALNDSGAAIAIATIAVAVPLALAMCSNALTRQRPQREQRGDRSGSRRRRRSGKC